MIFYDCQDTPMWILSLTDEGDIVAPFDRGIANGALCGVATRLSPTCTIHTLLANTVKGWLLHVSTVDAWVHLRPLVQL